MGELVAVRSAPADTGTSLRQVWAAGDAALPLASDAPATLIERVLATQRPARLLDVAADGTSSVRRLSNASGVDDDVALVVTTSGTTGAPKGVALTHAALRASTDASLARLGCRPGERWALMLPTHHIAGIAVLLRSWALGTDAEPVGPDPTGTEAQHVSLVPTQLVRLLDDGHDLSAFRTVLLGGAPAPAGLLTRARDAGVRVVVSYGMSETSGGCVYDGRPLDGVDVEVTGGRIRVRGPVLFSGYRPSQPPPPCDADGWFTTADRGELVDGRLEVRGRADEVLVSGGENVPVAAVEQRLASAPGVARAAVTSLDDARWGQRVVAVVVPRDASAPPSLEELRDHVRRALPKACAPRQLLLVARLPTGPMGEVSRAALQRLVTGT